MPNLPAPAVANVILARHRGLGRLTQMQLQKLTYFAHGWNLAVNGEPLVADGYQAWTYGPVSRDLYDHTKFFGRAPVSRLLTEADDDLAFFLASSKKPGTPYTAELSDSELDVVDRVVARYGSLSAFQLSELTHQPGTPWHRVYRSGENARIPDTLIREHYVELAGGATA